MQENEGKGKTMEKIRVGVVGYGNLGRGVLHALSQCEDMETVALFSRRDPSALAPEWNVKKDRVENVANYVGDVDVLILCGGSATDLPVQSPELLKTFHIVDSFDTHAKIPQHYATLDAVGKESGKVGVLSVGWDPGLFSLARIYFGAVTPDGKNETFWGKGVSQGHSDAIRRIKGVKNAVQYTVPKEEALQSVRSGERKDLTARQKHLRECFVVAEDGADKAEIERTIREMPNYFADYDVVVHFISEEELKRDHSAMPHGGFVCRAANSANGNAFTMELSLKLGSNPEFTAGVLVAYARAAYRLGKEGKAGAFTAFDVAPKYLSPLSEEEQRAILL